MHLLAHYFMFFIIHEKTRSGLHPVGRMPHEEFHLQKVIRKKNPISEDSNAPLFFKIIIIIKFIEEIHTYYAVYINSQNNRYATKVYYKIRC